MHTRDKRSEKTSIRTIAILGALAIAAPAVAAIATGTLRGRVLDGTGRPVPTATCRLDGRATSTDRRGAFAFEAVRAGRHRLACATAGYRPSTVVVRVLPGGTLRVRVVLRARPDQQVAADAVAPKVEAEQSAPAASPRVHGRVPRSSHRRMHALRRKMAIEKLIVQGGAATGSGHGRGLVGTGRSTGIGGGSAFGRAARRRIAFGTRGAYRLHRPLEQTPEADREGYDRIREAGFVSPRQQPLSTVSIDVDTAAYSNVRRFIHGNRLPPEDAVRIEELLNYFDYDYAGPTGNAPFAVHAEVSTAPWNPAHRLVHIGLQGRRIKMADLPPNNLVFLIDVSGSMRSSDKLPLLKAAFSLLVDQLRPRDRVAIVVYAGAAGMVLPPTSGADKPTILEAIGRLQAGGSTAGAQGIRLAYRTARRGFVRGGNNRVILATDGDFNVGASSDGELERLIEKERKSGVFLTVLGFGTGNYQDAKMQKLADRGNGQHAYIDSLLEAQKVMVRELGATLMTIAKDVKVQVEFNPAKVKGWRLIGYENRVMAARDFDDDRKDAGELGAGHSVTFLYELIPAGSDEPVRGHKPLRYQERDGKAGAPPAAGRDELLFVKLRYKPPRSGRSKLIERALVDGHTGLAATSDNFRFAAAVAEMGLLLRHSPHRGRASFASVIRAATGATGRDPHGERRDFVGLAREAAILAGARPHS